ncbi:hypothetical protein L596_022847 [Steinernema carpocapsae]|uniref:Uncharacterized protein n=1 Tax=Steinernema carpocapsae TaxID=34508 RepID=A0A4U5MMX9_STECR|nr:hypothetical protein L596_022847 [Steinernema carpocapsae]
MNHDLKTTASSKAETQNLAEPMSAKVKLDQDLSKAIHPQNDRKPESKIPLEPKPSQPSIDTTFITNLVLEPSKDTIFPEPLATSTLKRDKAPKTPKDSQGSILGEVVHLVEEQGVPAPVQRLASQPDESGVLGGRVYLEKSIDASFIPGLLAHPSSEDSKSKTINLASKDPKTSFIEDLLSQPSNYVPKKTTTSDHKCYVHGHSQPSKEIKPIDLTPEPAKVTIDTSFVADLISKKPKNDDEGQDNLLDNVFAQVDVAKIPEDPGRKLTIQEVERFDHSYISQYIEQHPRTRGTVEETVIRHEDSNLIEAKENPEPAAPKKPARSFKEPSLQIPEEVNKEEQKAADQVAQITVIKAVEDTEKAILQGEVKDQEAKHTSIDTGFISDLLSQGSKTLKDSNASFIDDLLSQSSDYVPKKTTTSDHQCHVHGHSLPSKELKPVDLKREPAIQTIDTSFVVNLVKEANPTGLNEGVAEDILASVFSQVHKELPSEEPTRKVSLEEVQEFDSGYIEKFIANNPSIEKRPILESTLSLEESGLVEPEKKTQKSKIKSEEPADTSFIANIVAQETITRATSEADDVLTAIFDVPKKRTPKKLVHQDSVQVIRRSRNQEPDKSDLLEAVFAKNKSPETEPDSEESSTESGIKVEIEENVPKTKDTAEVTPKQDLGKLQVKDKFTKKVSISEMEAIFIKLTPDDDSRSARSSESETLKVEKPTKKVSISAMKPKLIGVSESYEDLGDTVTLSTVSSQSGELDSEELDSSTPPKGVDLAESDTQLKRYGRKLTVEEVGGFDSKHVEKFIAEKPKLQEFRLQFEAPGVIDTSFIQEMFQEHPETSKKAVLSTSDKLVSKIFEKVPQEVSEHMDKNDSKPQPVPSCYAKPLHKELAYIDDLVKASRQSKSIEEASG